VVLFLAGECKNGQVPEPRWAENPMDPSVGVSPMSFLCTDQMVPLCSMILPVISFDVVVTSLYFET